MEANERLINAVRNGPYIGLSDKPGLPRIPKNESFIRRRILVQKTKPVGHKQNVPPTGQEYDYRRTPDSLRSGPRRIVQGCVRPQVPADTGVIEDDREENVSPVPVKVRNKVAERLDVARCPTPMPTDENMEDVRLNYPNKPLDTSRSAWDGGLVTARTDMCTVGGDLANLDNQVDIFTPRTNFKQTVPRKNNVTGNAKKYDVILSDMDRECGVTTPTSGTTLDLTENVIHYYFQKSVDKDKRIANWLADCEEKSKSINQLPAHLPDIAASRRNITLIVEDV